MKKRELIDEALKTSGKPLAGIAEHMGISRPALSRMRSGVDPMKDEHAITLADLAGIDPVLALAEIKQEQAKSPKAAAVWREMARRAQTAALLVWGLALWSGWIVLEDHEVRGSTEFVYYVKSTTALGLCLFLLCIMSLGWFRARPF